MNKLEEICAAKRDEVRARKAAIADTLIAEDIAAQSAPRGFAAALKAASDGGLGLIAEIKKASPSKGLIREDFDPADHARAYAEGGAACLSVLTDEPYFQGHADYLKAARAACDLPVLRKDFMIDPWQCGEARAMGADAILIIVAALSDNQMMEIEDAAKALEMDVLVEVHDQAELARVGCLHSRLIGINNRDLKSFKTDLAISCKLAAEAPEGALLVGESGIGSHADCEMLAEHGIRCFLVGEALMRQDDIRQATEALLHG